MRVEAVNSLGVSGAGIEIPWSGTDGDSYLDLRENPAAISQIGAARETSPLAGFLTVVNGAGSLFSTVRAKVWEEPNSQAGAEFTFHSRVDLMFARSEFNFISERYEDVVQRLVALWMKDSSGDALSVRMEILPCAYGAEKKEGAALRLTLTSRSASAEQARVRWALGIVRVQQALLFVSRAMRQKLGIDGDAE
ncbi:MAG TPA: hypothetical protein VIH72_09825 [Candidatus Acidoferrales bacterium]|jgi:hypothetical protein